MPLASGGIAHVNVNWLSPTKIRQMVIGGSRRTLVWDDLNPQQRISIHDRGVDLATQAHDARQRAAVTVSYRMGDITVPALPEQEALGVDGDRVRRRDQRGTRGPHRRWGRSAGAVRAGGGQRRAWRPVRPIALGIEDEGVRRMSGIDSPGRGDRVLVTGGAGTIGSTIVDQLLAAGVGEVRILDNLVRGRRANLRAVLDRSAGEAGRR